jgi:serine/threonine protein kinase
MGTEAKKTEEEIYHAALAKPATERSAFLAEACEGDPDLLDRIQILLASREEAGDFLNTPPLDIDVTLGDINSTEGPGTVIGHYKLLEKIGEGGMARVYMAEQERPIRRKVALKIIKVGMDTAQVIARFEAERQALALMDHPHIAKVLDAGATETGRPYFVMELVRGQSITQYCNQRRMHTQERLKLFMQVCSAVQHAHQKGIIHRDIKPSNVMVTQRDGSPVPKIIDFGIAKATNQRLTEKTLFTHYAQIIGTPAYMSPEQAELSELDVDTRSDIYSLGILLYELLTGTTPFSEEELHKAGYMEMQRIIREEAPTKPSTKLSTLGNTKSSVAAERGATLDILRRQLRGDLDWIVLKALEKNRDRRYDAASALVLDVQRYLAQEPVSARAPRFFYILGKYLSKHKFKLAISAAIIVLLAAVVSISLMWNDKRIRLSEATKITEQATLFQAREAFAQRELETALQLTQSILNSVHVGAEARLLHASLLVEGMQSEEAVSSLQDLLTEVPEIAGVAHALLARVYWEGDFPETEKLTKVNQHRQRAETLLPETAESYFLRALTTPSIKEKLSYLDQALDLAPGHYESLKLRAFIRYAQKEHEATANDARILIALQPQDSTGYQLRGLAQQALANHKEAVQSFGKAIKWAKQDASILVQLHSQRRQTHMFMGEYRKAADDARRCIALDEATWVHHFHLYCAQVALGHHAPAEATYENHLAKHRNRMLCRYCTDYVLEMLERGKDLNLPQDAAQRAAFLPLVEAVEYHQALSSKSKRVISDGFVPSWSPDGTKLIYSMGGLGLSGIATYDISSGKTNLLIVPGKDPFYAPNSKHIVFVRDRPILPIATLSQAGLSRFETRKEREEIWIMNADGTAPRFLARGYQPSWSQDSQRVYFTVAPSKKRYSIPVNEPRTEPSIENAGFSGEVRESPDGRHAAYADEYGVYVMDSRSGKVLRKWMSPPPAAGWSLAKSMIWAPNENRFCIGGVYETHYGGWMYDIAQDEPVRFMKGPIWPSGWSKTGRLALGMIIPINDVWITDVNYLSSGCSVDQHCQEMLEFYQRRLQVDPNDGRHTYWHRQFQQYIQSREEDWIDRAQYDASPWTDPTSYGLITPQWTSAQPYFYTGDFWVSNDGLELYFGANRSQGLDDYDIWTSTRAAITELWGEPESLGHPVNTAELEACPWLSSNGLCLYFATEQSGGYGNLDLWFTTRSSLSDPWDSPVNLGTSVNTEADECFPCLSADGLTLYFSGYRNARKGSLGESDIWMTTRSSLSTSWERPSNLGPLINSPFFESNPFVSADGLILMFDSDRPGSYGEDIWVAERSSASEAFGKPIPLGPPVNSAWYEACPFFAEDGTMLYFLTTRVTERYNLRQVPLRKKMNIP